MKNQLLNALKVVILLLIPSLSFAQAPPLGTAADFVLFTSVGAVTNVGTYKYLTHLTGNVGTNSGSSTNFGNVNGVMHDGDGASAQCAADLLIAYNSLNAAIPDSSVGLLIGNGDTIKAGTYLMPGAASLNLGLTLNAEGDPNAVFIFKTPTDVAYAFSTSPDAKIHLMNGAQACNVFWLVSGAVNIGPGTTMRGTIVAGGAINLTVNDTLEGRALTINGAVTVSNGDLGLLAYTPIGCGSPILNGPTAPTFVATASYAVFATTGAASDCGTSHINGDVGGNTVAPTGFNPDSVTGGIYFNNPSTNAAAADLLLVYDYLLALPHDIKLMAPTEFGHNLVLTPHTYLLDASVTFTDTVYLDAQGNANAVFVIKTYGAFASGSGSNVVLVNGTQSKNVYWFCTAAVSIGTNSKFKGAIIAHDAIEMLPGANLDGRVFSTHGALTLCGITASLPSPISAGPANQSACEGSSVSLTITASGTDISYQWRRGTVNLINGGNISGVTNDTLTFDPVSMADTAFNYNVIVSGPTTPAYTSSNASLTVYPLPAAIAGPNRGICLSASTILGATAVIGSTYSWTSMPVGFISTQANPTVTPLVTTTYTIVETDTTTGCIDSNNVVVTVNPLPVPTIAGNANGCVGTAGNIYTTEALMTNYVWTVSAGGTITAGAGTNMITVTWNTTGPKTISVNYTNGNSCTALLASVKTVTVYPLPAPTITGDNDVCSGSAGNVYTTEATMTNYVWTVSAGGTITAGGTSTSNTVTVTWNTAGSRTVSVNYTNANGCAAANPSVYNVTVNALPAPTITGPANLCQGSAGNVYTTQSGMTAYLWTVSAGGTITAGGTSTSNTVTITWVTSGAQTVSVNYTNAGGCTGATPGTINVNANSIPEPSINIYNNQPCVGSTGIQFYTEPGMTNYQWTVTSGGTITAGQGTENITVTWIAGGMQTITLVYTNAAGCQNTIPSEYMTMVETGPNAAGPITGSATLCAGTAGVAYSTTPIYLATSYAWTVPAGATIVSGAGTTAITVNFFESGTSGNVTVAGVNDCGPGPSSSLAVTINPLPDDAGTISGMADVCLGIGGYVYSVPTIANATGYTWTVPVGATIVGGFNTKSIIVDFSASAVSGTITVLGTNACGEGTVSTAFEVTVNPIPDAPVITVIDELLSSNVANGNQWYFEGDPIPGATGQTHLAEYSGMYWDVVTINGCSSAPSNSIYIAMTGIDEPGNGKTVVYPVPNDGRFTISIYDPLGDNYSITVYNYLGVIVFEARDIVVKGTLLKIVDLRPIPNGIYYIAVIGNDSNIMKKIILNN